MYGSGFIEEPFDKSLKFKIKSTSEIIQNIQNPGQLVLFNNIHVKSNTLKNYFIIRPCIHNDRSQVAVFLILYRFRIRRSLNSLLIPSDGHPFSGFYFFPRVCSSVLAKLKFLREPNFDMFFSKQLSVLVITRICAYVSSAREN